MNTTLPSAAAQPFFGRRLPLAAAGFSTLVAGLIPAAPAFAAPAAQPAIHQTLSLRAGSQVALMNTLNLSNQLSDQSGFMQAPMNLTANTAADDSPFVLQSAEAQGFVPLPSAAPLSNAQKRQAYMNDPQITPWLAAVPGRSAGYLAGLPHVVAFLEPDGQVAFYHELNQEGNVITAKDITTWVNGITNSPANSFEDFYVVGGHGWTSPAQQLMEKNEFVKGNLINGGGVAFMNDNFNQVVTLDYFGNPTYRISINPAGSLDQVDSFADHPGMSRNYTVRGFGPGAPRSAIFWNNAELEPFIRIPNPAAMPEPDKMNRWVPLMREASIQYRYPLVINTAKIYAESKGNPNAESEVGARGLCQMMPGTASGFGIHPDSLWNPSVCISAGAMYMHNLHNLFSDWSLALAAYHAGPAAVESAGGVPNIAQTRKYVSDIGAQINSLSQGGLNPLA